MPTKNNTVERLVALETTQKFILSELKEIRKSVGNHLTDVRDDISDIKKQQFARPSWLISILLTAMSSIIVALIIFTVTR